MRAGQKRLSIPEVVGRNPFSASTSLIHQTVIDHTPPDGARQAAIGIVAHPAQPAQILRPVEPVQSREPPCRVAPDDSIAARAGGIHAEGTVVDRNPYRPPDREPPARIPWAPYPRLRRSRPSASSS